MTNGPDPIDAAATSWRQLEEVVERLHSASRRFSRVDAFYRCFVENCAAALGGQGGAVWQLGADQTSEILGVWFCERREPQIWPEATRKSWVQQTLDADLPWHEPSLETTAAGADIRVSDHLFCPVSLTAEASTGDESGRRPMAVIELFFSPGADPLVRHGRVEFVRAAADAASDFHAFAELRRLTVAQRVQGAAIDLLRNVYEAGRSDVAALVLANEGRRVVNCDRLSVLQRRGRTWRLAAVSGVDSPDGQSELARRLAGLAKHAAAWREPVQYSDGEAQPPEYPFPLAQALADHVDRAQVRSLAAATFCEAPQTAKETTPRRRRTASPPRVALIAESFAVEDADTRGHNPSQPNQAAARLQQLGELTAPALIQALELERFPLGAARGIAHRLGAWRDLVGWTRTASLAAAAVASAGALAWIRIDWAVDLPAQLFPSQRSQVFASASGVVEEVLIDDGDQVSAGEKLLVLRDADLLFQYQQVEGELATARQKLSAVRTARTDRRRREGIEDQSIPLSAQQQQLEQRIADLEREQNLLEVRRTALTLRSPCAGRVLTRDLQRLLASRPVERGEALLTIADPNGPWELTASAPQRVVGRILTAHAEAERDGRELVAAYRLAGEVEQSHPARVLEVAGVATLHADGLLDSDQPIEVRLAIDQGLPADAHPGGAAQVRIVCGQRSLAHVWFYDVWTTLYRWITF